MVPNLRTFLSVFVQTKKRIFKGKSNHLHSNSVHTGDWVEFSLDLMCLLCFAVMSVPLFFVRSLDNLLCSLTAGSTCTGSHAADICVQAGPSDMAFTAPRWVSLSYLYPLLSFLTHQVLFISVRMNVCMFVCVFVCFGAVLCVQCLCV